MDGLGRLVRSVADASVDQGAGRWDDHRKASDRGCPWAVVRDCLSALGRDCPKEAEDVAVARRDEQRVKRLQRDVARRVGRGVAAAQELEDVDQARHRVRRGEAAVQAEQAWQAEGLMAPVIAAKLEWLAGLVPEVLPAELRAQREQQAE